MSNTLYSSQHRALQDEFDSRRMADLMEGGIVHDTLSEVERTFITSVDMFFLSTVDHNGHPTVSYKGGLPGFVKVLDERTIAFPSYDGNGMFYSMGNISATAQALYVHPNTLRQRLRRIEELTGISIKGDDWLMIEIALKLIRLEEALGRQA